MRRILPAALIVITCLAAVAGVNAYQKRTSIPAEVIEEMPAEYVMAPPDAGDTVYEASNTGPQIYEELFPGKGDLFQNPDGTYTYHGKTYKRNTYMKAILCMGIDRSDAMTEKKESYFGGQADAIFLIAQDTARNTIKVVMLPRDTITDVNIIDEEGNITERFLTHLNAGFAFGDGMHVSAENEVKAVSDFLGGLEIDHYLAADMVLLPVVNDMVDGVTVTVPSDELSKKYPEWTKGTKIILKGEEAERFIRYRDVETDGTPIYRMDQHRQYITGFYGSLKKKNRTDPNIVTEIYDTCTDHMVTDMNKAEILKLSVDAMKDDTFGADSITQIRGNVVTKEYDEFYPDFGSTYDLVIDLFYREVP